MSRNEQVARQRAFYQTRAHDHLRVRDDDHYARKLAFELARAAGIGAGHRVLELGAGFGRFTFPLLERCGSVVALDLSARVLEELAQARDERNIPESRCRTLCADVDALGPAATELPEAARERFDFVVGFFFLHHLADFSRTIGTLGRLLPPGGGLAFLEPNRRNPLFVAQVMACADMGWREEKGMFALSRRGVEAAFRDAGLDPGPPASCGFFPPQLFNRFGPARRLEDRVQGWRPIQGWLPFLLLTARAPGRAGDL